MSLQLSYLASQKSILHHSRGITSKRVTSGGAHVRSLAPGQLSFEKTSQQLQPIGDNVSDLTDLGFKLW